MGRDKYVKDTIIDYVHKIKELANEYWWDPIDAHEMYDELSEAKNVILSNQTNYTLNEDVLIMED